MMKHLFVELLKTPKMPFLLAKQTNVSGIVVSQAAGTGAGLQTTTL
jgi:hypothetical protein